MGELYSQWRRDWRDGESTPRERCPTATDTGAWPCRPPGQTPNEPKGTDSYGAYPCAAGFALRLR